MNDRIVQIVAVIGLITLISGHQFLAGGSRGEVEPPGMAAAVIPTASAATFAELHAQTTNACGGGAAAVDILPMDGRLQGACCGEMNEHAYEEQLEALKAYAAFDVIPKNPYDVPADWAKWMIAYGERTQLDAAGQAVYDEAVELSHEGGPCCCKCWHWYAYEGLAEYLIEVENLSAEEIGKLWDISDACGGDHAHHH